MKTIILLLFALNAFGQQLEQRLSVATESSFRYAYPVALVSGSAALLTGSFTNNKTIGMAAGVITSITASRLIRVQKPETAWIACATGIAASSTVLIIKLNRKKRSESISCFKF
jgi:protoporphyrinogen oxidase